MAPAEAEPDVVLLGAAARQARAHDCLARLRPAVEARATAALADRDADLLLARIENGFVAAHGALERLYGSDHDLDGLLDSLLRLVTAAAAARPDELRRLDRTREVASDWYLREAMVGYVAYVDRFAGDLAGVEDHLDYLGELGITYLHAMPLLEPRPAPNDGGYAVADYRRVDHRLGDMDDLSRLCGQLRARGISLCVDVVVNHVAQEHGWAQKALEGDEAYRDYFLTFPDRAEPDRFEKTVREVFPDTAPGNFTWEEELDRWVWTTFHPYQWDLNYRNPAVFAEMADVMLFLANRGVEVLRLDAVPFMWKRVGTPCENLDEVHAIVEAWRALVAMAAPAVIFKSEAIVPREHLLSYLGAGERVRHESELAYHNQLMVQAWSALAARDTRLMTHALGQMPPTPAAATWVTYVRNHDDIGWAIGEDDAAAVGWGGWAHRRFLADFYAGDFPGSFAAGERFQVDEQTGDARTSGTTASLAGIEAALAAGADPARLDDVDGLPAGHPDMLLDHAVRRLLLLYAVAASYGGIPLVWMGDELALLNDLSYRDEPAHAHDNRWMHRPRMDWSAAARRHDPGTVEGRVFAGLRRLLATRAATPQLHSGGTVRLLAADDARIFAFARNHPRIGSFLGVANVGDDMASCQDALVYEAGLREPYDALDPAGPDRRGGRLRVAGLSMRWLCERT